MVFDLLTFCAICHINNTHSMIETIRDIACDHLSPSSTDLAFSSSSGKSACRSDKKCIKLKEQVWIKSAFCHPNEHVYRLKMYRPYRVTLLSWILLAHDYEDDQYFKNSNMQYDIEDK